MGVEVRPFKVRCNIACRYCYQEPERESGNVTRTYDLEAIKRVLQQHKREFTLFGGEPLLLPIPDLEAFLAFGLEQFGRNSIQTNGTLITDRHISLFEKYKVGIGISIDGPGELNDIRWAGSLDKTRKATERTLSAIKRLCEAGRAPSLIVTLHRLNASPERLQALCTWFRELDLQGLKASRLHLLEVEKEQVRTDYALGYEDLRGALAALHALEKELTTLRFDLFHEMTQMLLGRDDKTSCIWHACDPYTTHAVQGVEADGQSSNCGRVNKEGVGFSKASSEGYERYIALYNTPQEFGGCKGCRFFLMCKGQCPGTAIDGDWRNRTEHCDVLKSLFQQLELELLNRGEFPLSSSSRRVTLESEFIDTWRAGRNTTMSHLLKGDRSKSTPMAIPSHS
jgi:uncharacterized protein